MGPCVRKHVYDHLLQPSGVAGNGHRLLIDLQQPDVLGTGDLRIAERFNGELREIDHPVDELLALVETREKQQVFDEPRHPQRLRLDSGQGRLGSLAQLWIAQREFGVSADRGQRRAQFMARVGDEPTHPLFVTLAGFQRRVDVIQECVQRVTDPTDLGAFIGFGCRNAISDRDLALSHGNTRNTLGGVSYHAKRPQTPSHDDRDGEPEKHKTPRCQQGDGRCDLRERFGHLAPAAECEHPVGADTVDRYLADGAALARLAQLLHDLGDLRVVQGRRGSVGVDVATRDGAEG